MYRMTAVVRLLALLAVLVLVTSACRGADESASGDAGGGDDAGTSEPAAAGSEAGTSEVAVSTDSGVTDEACENAVNPDNGCIYLGVISDFTGTFAGLGEPIARGVEAFWQRVNEDGGIGGYDIDATTFVRDNAYSPETHNEVYQEIKPDVAALAMSLGSPTTAAILDDLQQNDLVTVPASWTSNYVFSDVVLENGASYCIESQNAVAWANDNLDDIESVMAVHYPGDYGADAAYGAKVAAEELGLDFTAVETQPGQDNQAGAIEAIVSQNPDLVIPTTGPTDLATIVGQAAAQGYQGQYVGTSPTWNPGLIESPAFEALQAQYHQSRPWDTYEEGEGPGFDALREAFGEEGDDGLLLGWIGQYPLKSAIEKAIEGGDITRESIAETATTQENVDFEGMLPEGAGDFAAGEAYPRATIIAEPDAETSTGVSSMTDFITSDVAESFDFGGEPCWQQL